MESVIRTDRWMNLSRYYLQNVRVSITDNPISKENDRAGKKRRCKKRHRAHIM